MESEMSTSPESFTSPASMQVGAGPWAKRELSRLIASTIVGSPSASASPRMNAGPVSPPSKTISQGVDGSDVQPNHNPRTASCRGSGDGGITGVM